MTACLLGEPHGNYIQHQPEGRGTEEWKRIVGGKVYLGIYC